MKKKKEERFDVMIVSIETRRIAAVIGRNLNERLADRREITGLSHINKNYFVDIRPHNPRRKNGDLK